MTRYEFLESKRQVIKTAYLHAVKSQLPDMANLWLSKKIEIDREIGNLTVEEAEVEY